jgi:Uma2 family endonuclease
MGAEVETYRFSVEEFNKLGEAGIFDEGDRVELLDGEIIVMSPIGSQHAGVVMRLNSVLSSRLGARALIDPQNPTVVDEFSEPRPDLMLFVPRDDFYTAKHPTPEDILLLIEVSDTTLA